MKTPYASVILLLSLTSVTSEAQRGVGLNSRVNSVAVQRLDRLEASHIRLRDTDQPVADRVVIPLDQVAVDKLDIRTLDGSSTKPAGDAVETSSAGTRLAAQPDKVYLFSDKPKTAAPPSIQLSTDRSYLPGFGVVANDVG